jgi:hypothetical protein
LEGGPHGHNPLASLSPSRALEQGQADRAEGAVQAKRRLGLARSIASGPVAGQYSVGDNNHSVFSKNRDRLIEHDAVTELFNVTVEMANKRGLLSGEHFSVDGTLIRAWASHKSVRRKDGSDDGRPPEDWRGEPRSNDTHESKSDPESQLYRKSNAAPALPSYLGHVLTDNRHGLVVNVQASTAQGTAERDVAAQMLADVAGPGKRVEQCFGWGKLIGPIRQVMVQGLDRVDQLLTLTMATYNLTRLQTLAQLRPQCAQ